jgi:hypothetical protein
MAVPRRLTIVIAICIACLRGATTEVTPEEAEWYRATAQTLAASTRTAHGEIRFRTGAARENVDQVSGLVERELVRICRLLEVSSEVHYTVLLFDDAAAMCATLNLPEYIGGICSGATLVTTFNNDQGTTHELAHLVANVQIGPAGSAFLAEGLADALLKLTHGFPIHASVKYHHVRGRLPPLIEIMNAPDLAAWGEAHPQAPHSYNIAASWMRFLLETRGAARLKRYYRGGTVDDVFGVEQATLERQWHAALDQFNLRPEQEAVLASRNDHVDTPIALLVGDGLALDGSAVAPVSAGQADRTYRWRKHGNDVAGATQATLAFEHLVTADGGTYEVTVSDAKGKTIGSKKWKIVVVDPAKWSADARAD